MLYPDATHTNTSMFATDLPNEVDSKLLLCVNIDQCFDN